MKIKMRKTKLFILKIKMKTNIKIKAILKYQ